MKHKYHLAAGLCDLILGVDGSGLRDDPVGHWRDVFSGSAAIDDSQGDRQLPARAEKRTTPGNGATLAFRYFCKFGDPAGVRQGIHGEKSAGTTRFYERSWKEKMPFAWQTRAGT